MKTWDFHPRTAPQVLHVSSRLCYHGQRPTIRSTVQSDCADRASEVSAHKRRVAARPGRYLLLLISVQLTISYLSSHRVAHFFVPYP